MALHTFENKEYGMVSYVNEHVKGFSVTLKDVDADEFVPMAVIYPTVERAITGAKKAVS